MPLRLSKILISAKRQRTTGQPSSYSKVRIAVSRTMGKSSCAKDTQVAATIDGCVDINFIK